jgi:predicted unusual protein kinase regulating ubiquinone biosynthesis (AarF/ABC1/UbiB family)
MSDPKKLPTGRLGRVARLTLLGARTGAGLLLEKRGELAAMYAADVLGSMRGLAAKVGQVASYVDGVVPESKREAFEKALSALRDAAASSPPEKVRALVEEELGGTLDELFAEWDEKPFASASIGQVHRARLLDGTLVAVKVQHPGIEEAVEHDLANASLMSTLQGAVLGAKLETKRVMDEVKTTLREELDYRLEAQRQKAFAALHRGDPQIRIPRVIDDRSARRVLTTVLAEGESLQAASEARESDRRRWAETLWRFVFRSVLVGGQFNADPHPGNFFFHDGGAITAMDFGCVVRVPPARRSVARRLHRAAIDRELGEFREAAREMMGTKGGELEELVLDYMRRLFEPLLDSPYRITRPYAASLVDEAIKSTTKALRAPKEEFVPMPEGMIFMNRLQFGFYSVLARLSVEADYAAIERRLLAEDTVEMTLIPRRH